FRPDKRAQAIYHTWGEGPVDQAAQATVVLSVVVDDHRDEPVVDRPLEDTVHLHIALAVVVQPLVSQQLLRLGIPQNGQAGPESPHTSSSPAPRPPQGN